MGNLKIPQQTDIFYLNRKIIVHSWRSHLFANFCVVLLATLCVVIWYFSCTCVYFPKRMSEKCKVLDFVWYGVAARHFHQNDCLFYWNFPQLYFNRTQKEDDLSRNIQNSLVKTISWKQRTISCFSLEQNKGLGGFTPKNVLLSFQSTRNTQIFSFYLHGNVFLYQISKVLSA